MVEVTEGTEVPEEVEETIGETVEQIAQQLSLINSKDLNRIGTSLAEFEKAHAFESVDIADMERHTCEPMIGPLIYLELMDRIPPRWDGYAKFKELLEDNSRYYSPEFNLETYMSLSTAVNNFQRCLNLLSEEIDLGKLFSDKNYTNLQKMRGIIQNPQNSSSRK